MRLTIEEVIAATRGRLTAGSPKGAVTGVSTDSRTLKKGDLFFALRGVHFDGHAYVRAAVKRGAVGAVLQAGVRHAAPRARADFAVIRVPSTLQALGDLAASWRRRLPVPIVAITGSNGKTTTKEMTAAVLSRRYRVLKTEGNFNNLIGLPLTLFRLNPRHQVAVLEMGMNAPGEIHRLTEIASPQAGVITNVGRAHLEGLKSVAGVARAKGKLVAGLPASGLAVLNQDDPSLPILKKLSRAPVTTFGWGRGAQVRGLGSRPEDLYGFRFKARLNGGDRTFFLRTLGRRNVTNALAALAVGGWFKIPPEEMRKGLDRFSPLPSRMEILRIGSWVVVNDAYNANPDSMIHALESLRGMPARRRAAVLGEMRELGPFAARGHREVGERAARLGIDLLIGIGPYADRLRRGAVQGGMRADRVVAFPDFDTAAASLASLFRKGDLILVKGSRGARMERVLALFRRLAN